MIQSHYYYYLLLAAAAVFGFVNSDTYHVAPDDGNSTTGDIHSLQYYISRPNKYFVLNNQLQFKTGQYNLNTSILLRNIQNFTLKGTKPSSIKCGVSISIIVCNVNLQK